MIMSIKSLRTLRFVRDRYKICFTYLIGVYVFSFIGWSFMVSYLESKLGTKFIYQASGDFITYYDKSPGYLRNEKIRIKFMTTYLDSWVTHWKEFEKRYAASNCEWKCNYNHSIGHNNGTDGQVLVFNAADLAGHPDYLPTERNANQIWILLNSEAPWLTRLDIIPYNNVFNWTSFVRNDSDAPFYYAKLKRKRKVTTLSEQKLKKSNVYWMVSNCFATNHRDAYVDELKRHIPVDVFSQSHCYPGALTCHSWDPECDQLTNEYNFYLAFENANCRDYITEKLWRGLLKGVIPVVMRDSEGYKRVAPPGSYIDVADFSTPKQLAEYLIRVQSDQSLYQSYFSWRREYDIVDEWGCDLCQRLHIWNGRHQVYHDLNGWFKQDKCATWNAIGHVYLYTSAYWRIAKRWTLWILGVSP